MKKLLLLLSLFLAFNIVNAQSSFQVLDPDNNHTDVSNAAIDLWGDPTTDIEKEFDVKNIASSGKTVKLKRTIVSGFNYSLPDQDTVQICWNVCLPSTWVATQTTGTITINSNATASFSSTGIGFHSLFSPCSITGTRVIRYTFWDSNNTADSVNVTINYHITGVGISSANLKQFHFTNPQPNPTNGYTAIRYDFPFEANAKIKIYNAVGTLIKEIKLEEKSGKIILDTEEMTSGIYFYSLVVNDKISGTRKLIVTK
ncbi:MAG: T9SS type A sorting domain-containing protein [Bacteroidota bacterium]|jgi:hypothetical protein